MKNKRNKKAKKLILIKYKWIFIWAVISIAFLFIIHITFHIEGPKWMQATWSPGEILTYVSTVSLGLLAMWQNQKLQEMQKKSLKVSLAQEKYVVFGYGEMTVVFYNENSPLDEKNSAHGVENGFNGNKAFWRYHSCDIKNLNMTRISLIIENIGVVPATNIGIVDINGEKIECCNVLQTDGEQNDKKYIVPKEKGRIFLNFNIEELRAKNKLEYFLQYSNLFGSKYRQKIVISTTDLDNLVQVDTQCELTIMEDE